MDPKSKVDFPRKDDQEKIMWNFQGSLFLTLEFPRDLKEHRQKSFVALSKFWPLKGVGGWLWGEGCLSESIKKENL